MRQITFRDIQKLNIAPELCYQWVSEMIANKRAVELPAKISLRPAEDTFFNIMPCVLPRASFGRIEGVKVVTRYPERKPSLDSKLLLLDADTGALLAFMDADWITAMRTGAVASHSILLLAKKNFTKIGIMGLGNTARATLLVLAHLVPNRELQIKLLKYKGQEVLFAKRFSNYPNLHFSYVDSPEQLVKGADVVISCATYLDKNVCSNDCFDEGVLVVPVHTRGFKNCDLFFDKIYADDTNHVCHFEHYKEFRSFAEICDVVNGNAAGRENDKERILAYNIGVAMHDINFAAHIYQMIKDDHTVKELDMQDPTEKFWV